MVQGIVTAATADKLTIKNDAGNSFDVTITADSRVMKDRQPIKLSDVKPGDSVTAVGEVAKTTVQARMVMVVDAATVAKAKENLGKTYITGKITAIDADNLKLTVMRTDNVSQVIAVDDGTSFQRGNRGVQADVAAAGGLAMGGMGGFGGRGGPRSQAAGAPPSPREHHSRRYQGRGFVDGDGHVEERRIHRAEDGRHRTRSNGPGDVAAHRGRARRILLRSRPQLRRSRKGKHVGPRWIARVPGL